MKKLFAVILSLGLIIAPVPVINTAHAGGAGGYAKMVLGMANGIVGSAILVKCKMGASQPSITAYFAGSLVYIAAEILGGKGKRKSVENNSASMDSLKANMKEGGDYQKASIQAQIDNEKDTLKHIEKKRKWMMATKVIYGLATALALVEFILQFPPPPAGIGIGKPDIGACSPDGVSHVPAQAGIVMAYTAASGFAGGGLMGAGMAVAAPYIMKMMGQVAIGTKITDLAVTMLNSSLGRVAFFGAATALVMMLDNDLKKEADRSKKIIADLEQVKAQFEAADNSLAEGDSVNTGGATSGALGGGKDDPTKKTYAVTALASGTTLAKHCFANASSGGVEYSESSCNSPIRINRPSFDGKFDIGTLKNGTNAGIDMAQAIANGDLASADVAAGNLASMAGKVDAINKELMKKVDDQLKAQGKKPIDIKGELNRQVTALNNALNKQQAGSGNYSMADLDGGEASTSSDVAKVDTTAAPEVTTAAAPAASPIEAMDLSKLDELGGTEVVDPDAAADTGKVASLEDSLNQYESNENDISTDPGVSIFKQVSNRYILNYGKIFERKQINPPMAEPQPSN